MHLRRVFIFCLILLSVVRVFVECDGDYISCHNIGRMEESRVGRSRKVVEDIRISVSRRIRSFLPSPHSELILGLLLGVDDLNKNPKFRDALRNTGTIHVVVVSGYNVSLVFMAVVSRVGSQYNRKGLILAQGITLFYSVVSGFGPPVVRSWVMLSLFSWGRYYGRKMDGVAILVVSALFMIAIRPSYLFSLSFQLSFLATVGLVWFSSPLARLLGKAFGSRNVLIDDLGSTLAAQVFVWPLISYRFSSVSVISPLVNALALWTIPLSTMIGFVFLVAVLINPLLGNIMSIMIFPFLDIFIKIVMLFDNLPIASLVYGMPLHTLLIYYFAVVIFSVLYLRKV